MEYLNTEIDYFGKAQSTLASFTTTDGILYVGNNGVEFIADQGKQNFIHLPWSEIVSVRAQVITFFKIQHVRSIYIKTRKNGSFQFYVKEPKPMLRTLRDRLGKDKMFANRSVIRNLFSKKG